MAALLGRFGSESRLPTMPDGWPIGSYDSYKGAQRAVDHLAGADFPVGDLTIVGVEPMLVERVDARLTWQRVLTAGAMSGAWLGMFVGLLLSLATAAGGLVPILVGLAGGVGFGVASAAIRYSTTKGQHGFVSHSHLVARQYDVLSLPRVAQRGTELLAALELKGRPTS
jgi:hypothetical protein